MTIPEIQALKAELEVALLQAFTDFERLTGANINDILIWCKPTPEGRRLTSVTVQLESL